MQAVVKSTAAPGFVVADVAEPEPAANEVVLDVEAASVCGTDLHLFQWNEWAASRVHPPRVMGHEMAGRVAAIGDGVDSVREGARVAVESHVVCGHCPECRRGDMHVCANTRILGVDVDGVFARRVRVPARNLWPVPEDLAPELATLMEPFGNAVHAASYGRLRSQTVGVLGCGPIGLFAIAIARAEGAALVVAVDRNPYRLELASRVGADVALDTGVRMEEDVTRAAGGMLDCVLEMSGHPSAVAAATRMVRPGGWISLLGIGDAPATLDTSRDVVMKGLTLYGVTGRRLFSTWERTTALVAGGVDVSHLVTHRFPLADVGEAMELVGTGQCGKVVLFPQA